MKNKVKVVLLDNTEVELGFDRRSTGQTLLDKVCDELQLLEKDYFGLAFPTKSDEARDWLANDKPVIKQLRNHSFTNDSKLYFEVKFYPPDPVQLHEDITRYFVCLQVRRDVLTGRLPCSFVTHALLGSYMVQSDFGDFDPQVHGPDYLRDLQFAPQQSHELEMKIAEMHQQHRGQTSAEADLHYLENARKLAMYGVDLHPAKDSAGIDILMGVCASGLLVYRDRLRINRFAWPKILKISYKRSNFYIRIRPGEFDQYEGTVGFKLANMRAAKRLWKTCVEHHTFFRLTTPEEPSKHRILLPRFGSKFRYSGRTQHQSKQASMQIKRQPPEFQRTLSTRNWASKAIQNGRSYDPKKSSYNRNADVDENSVQSQQTYPVQNDDTGRSSRQDRTMSGNGVSYNSITTHGSVSPSLTEESLCDKKPAMRRPVGGVAVLPPMEMRKIEDHRKSPVDRRESSQDRYDRTHEGLGNGNSNVQQSRLSVYDNVDSNRRYSGGNRHSMGEEQLQKVPSQTKLMQSRSREQLAEDRQNFFEKSNKQTTQKPSYTREYSYNVDSKNLQQPGQTDPRGLGFSYERSNLSNSASKSYKDDQVHKGTALAFSYDPQNTSKVETTRQTREYSSKKIEELKYGNARTAQREARLSEDQGRDRGSGYDLRSKSPDHRGTRVSTNLDESSEISSNSKDSMVNEYAKESIRQKTSSYVASTASPKTSSDIYKSPVTQSFSSRQQQQSASSNQTTSAKPKDTDRDYRARSTEKPRTLWGQESSLGQGRQPILSSSEVDEVDRKYAELTRSRNASMSRLEDPKVYTQKTPYVTQMDRNDAPNQDSSRVSKTISSRTSSHKTDHEDLSKPDEGIIHKKKTDTIVEKERVMRKQTENRNMILTGKYEDLAQMSYDELLKYGSSQPQKPIPGLDREAMRNAPVVNAMTKVDSNETKLSNYSKQPRNQPSNRASEIAPPKSFANNSSVVALPRDNDDSEIENGQHDQEDETISSKTRTVETMTFKMEKDGLVETRVEHKITIKSDGDPVDHDRALAEAIQEATMMDPKMTVQKIEITQQAPLN